MNHEVAESWIAKVRRWLFHNQSARQTIAKNTAWLFIGQLGSRLFRAAIVIYAARVLGAAHYGAFSYALSIAAFLTIFSDIGINALITKEASRDPGLKDRYVATAFFTKLGLVALLVLGVSVFFPYLTNIPEAARLMPILIFVFAFDTLRDLGSAVSRALERMEIEAMVAVGANLAIVVLGFLALWFSPTSYTLALAYAAGSGAGLVATLFVLRVHFRGLIKNFTRSLVKPILVTAWPFGLLGLMGAIMLNTDLVMLGWLRSPEEIGYYSAAQKIIQLLYVLPALVASSMFPALVRLVSSDPAKARAMLEQFVLWVSGTGILIAVSGALLASPIITILYGEAYAPAIFTLRLLMLTVAMVYPSTLLGNAIFAYDRQKKLVFLVAVTAVGNVFFNFLFIPRWGIEGAALATIVVQLVTNFILYRMVKRVSGVSLWPRMKHIIVSSAIYPRGKPRG